MAVIPSSKISYLQWNDLLAKHFFNEEKAGKEVLLYVNEPLIDNLGAPHGVGVTDFINALHTGPEWSTKSGFCQKAIQALEKWRARNLPYPPYIAYLACCVLAAGDEGDFSPHAYYPKLRKRLGEPESAGQLSSFDRMIDLWDDLEKWSLENKHEELGRFVARIRGRLWKVGLPLSQILLSEDERKALTALFENAELDPTNAPSPEIVPALLLKHGQQYFENRTLRLLNSTSQDDLVLQEALNSLILDELETWDGIVSVTHEDKACNPLRSRIQTASLRICFKIDSVARSIRSYFRFKTGKIFPEDGLNFEQKGTSHVWSCNESHQGWSKILKDQQLKPPLVLDGAAIDWKEGGQFDDKENHWRAHLRGATARLFFKGELEGLPDWIESQRLERGREFFIACYVTYAEKVKKWGPECCEKFELKQFNGLPSQWVLFLGKNATQSCPGIDVLSLSTALRLRIKGGIKVGGGNAYLNFPLPEVVLENSSGQEVITANDAVLQRVTQSLPIWKLPQNTSVNEILRIEVKSGEQELRKTLRLEEPTLPLSFNKTLSRDSTGKICTNEDRQTRIYGVIIDLDESSSQIPPYPKTLPTFLSDRIIFIGEKPGQIADWPSEPLPSEWHPVWAITKQGNKKWESHFCGKPEHTHKGSCKKEQYGNAAEKKRWRETLWINRKITKYPSLHQLRAVWMEYLKVAQNV